MESALGGALGVLLLAPTASGQGREDKALRRPASASSVERLNGVTNPALVPAQAVDGNGQTRWSSDWRDGQWWQVDLGRLRLVDSVTLDWEAAFSPRHVISTSVDGATWSPAAEVQTDRPGLHTVSFPVRDVRWLRVTGLTRALVNGNLFGVSFWTVHVFGPPDDQRARFFPPPPPPAPPPVVVAAAPAFLTPFPVVRFRGRLTRRGTRIELLTVKAPAGALVEVECRGRRCPPIGRWTSDGLLRVRRLRRALRPGTLVLVRVSEPGRIGKYTRLRIQRRRLPVRRDACLAPGSRGPNRCPAG